MSDQNRIDFRVGVTDEGLPKLAENLKKVDAGVKGLDASADAAGSEINELGGEMAGAATKAAPLEAALSAVGKAVAGLFALNKAKDFALDTIALADAYGQMAERISMATPVAGEYDRVQERILATANLTYRRLEEQQELYIRTADALRSMGYETEQALDIQDSFSFLLTTNAASVERGKNAIDAYTKSIQSGKVEVDSWQSIMSAMPTIVDTIAQSTGKTAAEIRALGITGKLSISDINEGLRQTVELNKEVAAGMSATVADAVTRLTNTWTTYIGEANRANQSTEKIVNAIDMLSENLDTVINVAITAGEVMAAVWGVKALQALTTYVVALKGATLATQALTVESLKAASAAEKIGMAGKLAAAGWVGWEVGTFLREEFEVVEKAGIALAAGLQRSAVIARGAWEALGAVFTDDTVEAAMERTRLALAEVDDGYAQLFEQVGKLDVAQKGIAGSTEQAGAAAANASVIWAGLRKDYSEVATALEKQSEQLQKSVILKNAEAAAAVQMAQAFGTEIQERQAQAQAAQVQADQLRRVAELRSIELQVLQAEREALIGLGEATIAMDPIKQKELADLEQKIALRQADAGAAIAQAQAGQVAAAQAQAETEALADNSARVDELRIARDRAAEALERVRRQHAAGQASLEDLTKADIAAGRAALLYRDALSDQVHALQAKARAVQAAFSVEESALRLAIEQQKAIIEVARARGDERTVMAAQAQLRKLEIQLLELQAKAKRAEADAQIRSVEAQRAALIASGQLTTAKRAELDAVLAGAKVKQTEAEIAEVTAKKMRDLAEATRDSGMAAKEARGGYDDATEGMKKMGAASGSAASAKGNSERGSDTGGGSFEGPTEASIMEQLTRAGMDEAAARQKAGEVLARYEAEFRRAQGTWGATTGRIVQQREILQSGSQTLLNQGLDTAKNGAAVGGAKNYNIKLDGGKGRRGDFRFSTEDDAEQALKAIELASGRS